LLRGWVSFVVKKLDVMDALNRAHLSTRVLVVMARQDNASIRAALSLGAAGSPAKKSKQ